MKTARLAISIITLLKEQIRVSRLSFADIIKRVSEFKKNHQAYVSSDPAVVERYVVVHGQIILQLFAEFPDEKIKKCAFVTGLANKMEERHHTKWLVKKKVVQKSGSNLNPTASIAPVISKRKAMQATTTRLINRIWGEYYSNYCPEDSTKDAAGFEMKEEDDVEEQEEAEEDDADEELPFIERPQKPTSISKYTRSCSVEKEIMWDGDPVGKTSFGQALYRCAIVLGDPIVVGGSVLVDIDEPDELSAIYFVEYMFETSDGSKMFHGRMMQGARQTVLGNTGNEREVFLTNECMDFGLENIKQKVVVDIRLIPWGHQHRKDNAKADKLDRALAEERNKKGLPVEYYCKSLYWPERGAFFSISPETMGLGSGFCHSCKTKVLQKDKEVFRVNASKTSFLYDGIDYSFNDYVYISPHHFSMEEMENETFKSGRNVGLKAYVVCQLLEILVKKEAKEAVMKSTQVKVRRFYRPEDISIERAYCSDVREVGASINVSTLYYF